MRNAATAIAALRALPEPLSETAIAEGVAHAHVAGRLQRFERHGVEVVVDVGHNPQAARELSAWLEAAPAAGRTTAVFAALGDKDVRGVVAALAQRIDGWRLAGLAESGPRGLDVVTFAQRLQDTAAAGGRRDADVATALSAAVADARPGDRILVFGSFHRRPPPCGWLAYRDAIDARHAWRRRWDRVFMNPASGRMASPGYNSRAFPRGPTFDESALKQRVVGAIVLVALAVIFLPMLIKGPAPESGISDVPLNSPTPRRANSPIASKRVSCRW